MKRHGCYVEVDGAPHEASWTGDRAVFNFTDTSSLTDFRLLRLQLTAEILTIWKRSRPIAFGGHGSVRVEDADRFPVIKIAHPSDECRQLVEREYKIMRELSDLDTVAQVASEPLVDHNGIFGFRLEQLHRVKLGELKLRSQEVMRLLDSLHKADWCHCDPSSSNIMQNQAGKLVLIDLAFAGRLGSDIPESFPSHLFSESRYTAEIDRKRIQQWCNIQCWKT